MSARDELERLYGNKEKKSSKGIGSIVAGSVSRAVSTAENMVARTTGNSSRKTARQTLHEMYGSPDAPGAVRARSAREGLEKYNRDNDPLRNVVRRVVGAPERTPNDQWQEDWLEEFYVRYNTDQDSAYDFAKKVNNQLAAQRMAADQERIKKTAARNPVASTIAGVVSAPFGLVDALDKGMNYAITGELPQRDRVTLGDVSRVMTGGVAEDLNKKYGTLNEEIPVIGGKGWGDAYSLGNSALQSLALGNAIGSVGTLATFFGQSAAAGIDEIKARGGTDGQAILYGLISGGAEVLTEKLPLDNLLKGGDAMRYTLKGWLGNAAKQGLLEGGEELASSIANEMADRWIMGDKSNFAVRVQEYVDQGMDEEKAKRKAWLDYANDATFDFIGGMASGAGSMMLQTGPGVLGANYQASRTSTPESNAALIGQALTADEGTEPHKLAQKYQGGEKLTGGQINDLAAAYQEYEAGKQYERAAEKAGEKLEELDAEDGTVATAIAKTLTGKDLNRRERRALERSEEGRKVLQDMQADRSWQQEEAEAAEEGAENAHSNPVGEADEPDRGAVAENATAEPSGISGQLERSVNESVDTVNESVDTPVETVEEPAPASDDSGAGVEPEARGRTIEEVAAEFGEQAGAVRNFYQEGQDVESYARGFRAAYDMGRSGVQEGYAMHSESTRGLTEHQRKMAWLTGKGAAALEAQRAGAALPTGKTGTWRKGTLKGVNITTRDIAKAFNINQRSAYKTMAFYAEATGVDVVVYRSTVDEATGKLVGPTIDGVDLSDANGAFVWKNDKIYIDINAGVMNGKQMGDVGRYTALRTFGHEFTHFVEKWNPDGYSQLRELVFDAMTRQGQDVDDLIVRQMSQDRSLDYDRASREVVAEAMTDILRDSTFAQELAKKNQTLFQKLREKLKQFAERIRSYFNQINPNRDPGAKALQQELEGGLKYLDEIVELYDKVAMDAAERHQAALAQQEAAQASQEELDPGQEAIAYNESGEPVAASTRDGTVQLSLRTYEEDGRETLRKYLGKCVTSKRLTKAEMQEMLDGIEEIYTVCKEFKDKYAPFAAWSDAAVVRDTRGKPVFSVVTPNGDYKMNLDFSLVCKKRRTLDAVFSEMIRQGIIDDFELGQKSVVKINEIIRSHGLETACALCFVDAKRFRQAAVADSFVKLYNDLVKSMAPEGANLEFHNFGGYEGFSRLDDALHTWSRDRLDFSHLDTVMREYGSKTVEHKVARYLKTHPEGRKLLMRGDFMSARGFDAVKVGNRAILSLYNSKKGTGGPKAAFGDVQYMNEILSRNAWTPGKAYEVGGVRIQSFSDYVPRMVFDYVQMIYDLAAKKLPAHAYTKEDLFVKQFGLTGAKINMSLIPAVAEGGIAPGLDAQGNYVWAGESFDFETAKQIQNAPGYTENCGTICVGVSYDHIVKLLGDPDIRMVIPYHKSGLNPIVAHMNKIAEFTDYTTLKTNPGGCQNTMDKDGNKVTKDFNFNEVLRQTGDPRATAQQYLDWCADKGYTARFAEFAWHENYYKLLTDFTVYDKDGAYVPQREVRAVFPKADAAFGPMKGLIEAGLQEDAVIEGRRDRELGRIVEEIKATIPRTEAEIEETEVRQAEGDVEAVQYSRRVDTSGMDENAKEIVRNLGRVHRNARFGIHRYASYSAERIEREIRDSAAINPDYARSAIAWIDPDEFIAATTRNRDSAERIRAEAGELDVSRLMDETQPIYLRVDAQSGEIIGHEGRHRISALAKAGYDRVAVILRMENTGDGRKLEPMRFLHLEGQMFDESMPYEGIGKGESFTVGNVLPLSRKYAEAAKTLFSEVEGGVSFSKRATDSEVVKLAKNHFGTTTDFEEAGFILPSGEMLRFTDDKHRGERWYDHRAIGIVYGATVDLDTNHGFNEESNKYLDDFVEKGGIRFDPGSFDLDMDAGMQLSKNIPLTAAQEQTIREFVEWKKQREEKYNPDDDDFSMYSGPLALHIEFGADANYAVSESARNLDAWGVKHLSYEGGQINASRIINDIRHYYRTGETRKPSLVAQFHGDSFQRREGTLSDWEVLDRAAEALGEEKLSEAEQEALAAFKGRLQKMEGLEAQRAEQGAIWHDNQFDEGGDREKARLARNRMKLLDDQLRKGYAELLSLEDKSTLQNVLKKARGEVEKQERQTAAEQVRQFRLDQNRMHRSDIRTMEREFLRLVREWEKSEKKAGKSDEKAAALREALDNEIAAHKADQEVWSREFARLMREYEKSDRKADKLAQRLEAHKKLSKDRVEGRKKTEMRHKIQRVVKELNDLLLKPDKKHHVPEGLRKAVAEALDMVNMERSDTADRVAKYDELISKETDQEKIDAYEVAKQTILDRAGNVRSRLDALRAAYEEIKNSADPEIANAYDANISECLLELSGTIGDTSVYDMSMDQLSDVYDMFKMVLNTIRDANKAFNEAITEGIREMADNADREITSNGKRNRLGIKMVEQLRKFGINNLKPTYFFHYLNSRTFRQLYQGLLDGQGQFARNMDEARSFRQDQAKKYGAKNWDREKTWKFKAASGEKFSLNLEQIMSLYAYSKRDQSREHIRRGGIVIDAETEIQEVKEVAGGFKVKLKGKSQDATAYNIDDVTLDEIIGKLTAKQRAYVDAMQDYLSDTMGAKGNEVSLKLYGIKLFKEKHYFPLKSAKEYSARAKEQAEQTARLKNAGFTKATKPHASNPIMLTGFSDVWADHVQDMSSYHAMTLPIEDIYRVYNYSRNGDGVKGARSVVAAIENAFGKQATGYMDQLLKDLNGGQIMDSAGELLEQMTSRFKKGAVFMSASVMIQQSSSVARALAEIDAKYLSPLSYVESLTVIPRQLLGKVNKNASRSHDALWAELKQYAPVAIIKEMGSFDMNMGKSGRDYLNGEEYSGLQEKWQAFWKDGNFRDELLSRGPALADELAWCDIWRAVKREVHDKHPKLKIGSEEFLKLCGARFTEIIDKTQVYDSVLSRSANMRSKNGAMKMATSFMAEPTVGSNMMAAAILEGKRGNAKKARRMAGAVMAGNIINAALAAIVYAARDDDEDEEYWEKYLGHLAGEVADSMNPLTYIPVAQDIVSVFQGWDVERADMAIVSDLYNAWNKLFSDKATTWEKTRDVVGAVSQIFSLPLKNALKDAEALWRVVSDAFDGQESTATGIGYAILAELPEWIPGGGVRNNGDQLYESILKGDKAHEERVRARFKDKDGNIDEGKARSALRKAIRENDSRIREAAVYLSEGQLLEYYNIVEEIAGEGFFHKDDVVSAIQSEANAMQEDSGSKEAATRHKSAFKAEHFAIAAADGDSKMMNIIKADLILTAQDNGKTETEAEAAAVGSIRGAVKEAFVEEGTLNENQVKKSLMGWCDATEKEASDTLKEWNFEKQNGYPLSELEDVFVGGEITADEAEGFLVSGGGYARTEAQSKVLQWRCEVDTGIRYDDVQQLYVDGEMTADKAKGLRVKYGESSIEDARKTVLQWQCEKDNGIKYSDIDVAYLSGDITEKTAIKWLVKYGEKDEEAAALATQAYRWRDQHAEYKDLSDDKIDRYIDFCEGAGISIPDFYEANKRVSEIKEAGGTTKENVVRYIRSLPLSRSQKWAIWYAVKTKSWKDNVSF